MSYEWNKAYRTYVELDTDVRYVWVCVQEVTAVEWVSGYTSLIHLTGGDTVEVDMPVRKVMAKIAKGIEADDG